MCALTVVRNIAEWQTIYRPGGHHSTEPWADLPEHHQPKRITYLNWPWYLFSTSLLRLTVPMLHTVPHYIIKTCCKCSLIWCKRLEESLRWGYANELALPVCLHGGWLVGGSAISRGKVTPYREFANKDVFKDYLQSPVCVSTSPGDA